MAFLHDAQAENLFAVVDMGSNGVRFSITDLSPPTTRIMPTLFQDRVGVSLYDAQFPSAAGGGGGGVAGGQRQPIPVTVIDEIVSKLLRFKTTCGDFNVPAQNIHVLATEATRTALNAAEFIGVIKSRVGWEVKLLSKQDEGRIGALGVASSFASVKGLVMDLGGGSTQLTWMIARDGIVETSPGGAISFPYGAAALTRRLQAAQEQGERAVEELRAEIKANFHNAYPSLNVPSSLENEANENGGFHLYLSGGGFRGWGYLLMSQSRLNPYPIPIINGFQATPEDFRDTSKVMNIAADGKEKKIFRVSKRRASQVPAVALLVNVLTECLPAVKAIRFCQGGVREGFLFEKLQSKIRRQDPLLVATMPYGTTSADSICDLLKASLPETTSPILSRRVPASLSPSLLSALSNLLFAHAGVPRETRPAAGLYSTTTGILASVNSLSHSDRAILALILSERWPGDLAPADKLLRSRLEQLVAAEEAWWCIYLGRVATLIGDVYPAGRIPQDAPRVEFRASWKKVFKKKQGTTDVLCLQVIVNEGIQQTVTTATLKDIINDIEKCGKLKNWIRAEDRIFPEERKAGDYGVCVEIQLSARS